MSNVSLNPPLTPTLTKYPSTNITSHHFLTKCHPKMCVLARPKHWSEKGGISFISTSLPATTSISTIRPSPSNTNNKKTELFLFLS